MSEADLIIIGAGPAGMAAAAEAAKGGLKVLMLDEQPRPGGQIYRNLSQNRQQKPWLGPDYQAGEYLLDGLNSDLIRTEFGATVLRIDPGQQVFWSRDDNSHVSVAPHVLLATGAQERPVPFPGWTLPGVMPAGAAQILMKSGLLPDKAVLAGSGPLLYLIAAQLIAAGAPPQALVETQTPGNFLRAARHFPKALLASRMMIKGLGLLKIIRKAGVKRYKNASAFTADTGKNGTITFSFATGGRSHVLETPLLLTHLGVIPSTHLSRATGIAHVWHKAQTCFRPNTDAWGRTNIPGLLVAGDGAGIGGAEVAGASGQLAVLEILRQDGKLTRDSRNQRAAAPRAVKTQALAIRDFLDATYTPSRGFSSPPDGTIVCRCEEVTAGEIRHSADEGARGHRQIKTATRAGMGPCQGRMCDLTVRAILSEVSDTANLTSPRARSPVKPVTLGELAAFSDDPPQG